MANFLPYLEAAKHLSETPYSPILHDVLGIVAKLI